MKKNRTPFSVALYFSILTFLVTLVLFWMLPALPELLYLALWEGSPLLVCLLLALLVGFLVWLNLKLAALKQQHSDDVWELRRQLEALRQELAATSSNDKD